MYALFIIHQFTPFKIRRPDLQSSFSTLFLLTIRDCIFPPPIWRNFFQNIQTSNLYFSSVSWIKMFALRVWRMIGNSPIKHKSNVKEKTLALARRVWSFWYKISSTFLRYLPLEGKWHIPEEEWQHSCQGLYFMYSAWHQFVRGEKTISTWVI